MSVEYWFLILLGAVLVMAEVVRMARRGGSLSRARRGKGKGHGAPQPRRRKTVGSGLNHRLAPRQPEVMAGAMFNLMAEILNHGQMVSFGDIITSSEMTERYIERLAAREATAPVAEKLAFFNEAMDLYGYSDSERASVAATIKARADKQYKLLAIHKNMDKIL